MRPPAVALRLLDAVLDCHGSRSATAGNKKKEPLESGSSCEVAALNVGRRKTGICQDFQGSERRTCGSARSRA